MNRIRELRKKLKMTQKELAEQLQVADSTLSYWETGRYEPDKNALMKLSRLFNVPIDYILDGDFIRWDINDNTVSYHDAKKPRLAGPDITVSEPEAEYGTDNLRNTQKAFDRVEFEDLTPGELDLLAEYALFIKSRRNKEQQSDIASETIHKHQYNPGRMDMK
jgi:transcriptional regulator with XRE-family HTH domain